MSAPVWSLICTIDDYLFAQVSDEIEAVRAVADHVAAFSDAHLPFVYMLPTPAEGWRSRCDTRGVGMMLERQQLHDMMDEHPNMYVAPKKIPSSWPRDCVFTEEEIRAADGAR